jgi:hypothetical protein
MCVDLPDETLDLDERGMPVTAGDKALLCCTVLGHNEGLSVTDMHRNNAGCHRSTALPTRGGLRPRATARPRRRRDTAPP